MQKNSQLPLLFLVFLLCSCATLAPSSKVKTDLAKVSFLSFDSTRHQVENIFGRPVDVTASESGDVVYLYDQEIPGGKMQKYAFRFDRKGNLLSKTFLPRLSNDITLAEFLTSDSSVELLPLPRVVCGDHAYYDKNANQLRDPKRGVWVQLDRNKTTINAISWIAPREVASRVPADENNCPTAIRSHLRSVETF